MSSQLPSASAHTVPRSTATPQPAAQSPQQQHHCPPTSITPAVSSIMASPFSGAACFSCDMSDLSCDTTLLNDSVGSVLETPEKHTAADSHDVSLVSASPETPRRQSVSTVRLSLGKKLQGDDGAAHVAASASGKRVVRPDCARSVRPESVRKSTGVSKVCACMRVCLCLCIEIWSAGSPVVCEALPSFGRQIH